MKSVKINVMHMIMEFASTIDNTSGIHKIMDEHGNIIVPRDKFGDFCHDMGMILAHSMKRIARPAEE